MDVGVLPPRLRGPRDGNHPRKAPAKGARGFLRSGGRGAARAARARRHRAARGRVREGLRTSHGFAGQRSSRTGARGAPHFPLRTSRGSAAAPAQGAARVATPSGVKRCCTRRPASQVLGVCCRAGVSTSARVARSEQDWSRGPPGKKKRFSAREAGGRPVAAAACGPRDVARARRGVLEFGGERGTRNTVYRYRGFVGKFWCFAR